MSNMVFFDDVTAFDFRQLSSGHWVGKSARGIFTSVDSFESGEKNDKFKHLRCRPATATEAMEYFTLELENHE